MLDKFKGYRTLFVNGAVFLGGAAVAFGLIDVAPGAEQAGDLFDQVLGGVSMVLGAVNAALRFATDTPVGKDV